MARNVALFRGVNVGGRHRLAMADLRELFESFGLREVTTLIQSGNVVCTGRMPTAEAIEAAVAARFGIETFVVLRGGDDLPGVLERNPFTDADPSTLHVGFLPVPPAAPALEALGVDRFPPEAVAVVGRELYFHLPDGMARAKLPGHLDRRLGVRATIRSWSTLTKLVELATG